MQAPMRILARIGDGSFCLLVLLASLSACSPKGTAQSTHTVDGTPSERVAAITKQLARNTKLPGRLLDAHFLEEQTGDGRLGPSDFVAFYALTVDPADLPAWRAAQPAPPMAKNDIQYAAPKKAQPWWVTQEDFAKLEFYSPKSLTGRVNGWVGLSPDGRIFIYSFTM